MLGKLSDRKAYFGAAFVGGWWIYLNVVVFLRAPLPVTFTQDSFTYLSFYVTRTLGYPSFLAAIRSIALGQSRL
jgi:hypothetical protein